MESHLDLNEFENKVVNLSAKANPSVDRYEWKLFKKFVSNIGHIGRNDLISLSSDRSEEWEDLPTKSSVRAKGSVLYISNVSRTDSGLYVLMWRKNRVYPQISYLNADPAAIVSLKIVTQHDRAVPREGDSYFQLHCKVDSNPVAKVKWKKEDITQTNENIDWFRTKLQEERQTFMQRFVYQISVLNIYNISRTDAGLYTCYTLGESQQILVNVNFKPKIFTNNLKIAADIEQKSNLIFECLANAFPYVHFNWSSNNGDIVSNNKYTITKVSVDGKTNMFKSELMISKLNQMDFKSYKCMAYNELGSDEVLFEMVKKSETNIIVF